MSAPGLNISKDKVSQKIDLNEIVGKDISGDPILVASIGQAIIDYIADRSEDGKGMGKTKLHSPYSDDYAESLDFKAAGKSKGDVNMRLSGDMISAIEFLDADDGVIEIGIDDPEQAIKAYGHQTGFRGHPTINDTPPRPFFGVTVSELQKEILPKFKKDIEELEDGEQRNQERGSQLERVLRTVSDLFDDEDLIG